MNTELFYQVVGHYGIYAIFIFVMLEGDITLLLAGVLAHSLFFGDYSFAQVLIAGTVGGVISDNIAYGMGRSFCHTVSGFHFYKAASPRIEILTSRFGMSSIFLSKFIWGLRWAACIFYGVGKMPYTRFLPLSLASCFLWTFVLSGAGYFFSSTVTNIIGDYHRIGIFLFIIVVCGIVGFYLVERYWLSKRVEEVTPEQLHKIEHAAQEKLHDLQERMHFRKKDRRVKKSKRKIQKRSEVKGD
jgi:membrane protein DedA with SNARE-associated domain